MGTHDTKERFNEKQLTNLNGKMISFAAKDNPSKRTPILPNFLNLNEQKTKGLLTMLKIKIGCPIKITININKKDSLVNGTFGYVCDVPLTRESFLLILIVIFMGHPIPC